MKVVSYNSPVILTFATISFCFLIIGEASNGTFTAAYLTSPGFFNPRSIGSWSSAVLHVLGHANYAHYAGNMMFILLLGPILEEKYGSAQLATMIVITALATAIANAFLFSSSIIGASGIVFMMIVLASITNVESGTIPLTTLLVLVLFVGKEVVAAFTPDNISHFAHIFGGASGAAMGLLFQQKKST
jgi:membrane associated rhomboid family serine protease